MNVYASLVVNGQEGWGDGFPALFICEFLKLKNPDWKFYLHDGPCMGTGHKDPTWRHRNFIKKPWFVEEFIEIPDSSDFDLVVATHCSHPYKPNPLNVKRDKYGGYLPPMNYNTEIDVIRFHSDRTMVELKKVGFRPLPVEVLDPPDVPDEYIAVQFRRNDTFKPPSRNILNGEEHDAWAKKWMLEFTLPIVSLSDFIWGIDYSHLNLWQKILVATHADHLYVSHSGFGMVLAMYSKADVINCSGTHRNPSIGVFNNVDTELLPQQNGPYVSAKYTLRPV